VPPPAFISYAREDSALALRLAAALKASGANVWLDQLDIEPGLPWDREVQRALVACNQMLLILTPTAVEKDNVMDEVDYALRRGKRIIPILYLECDVPLRLGRLHQVDMRPDYEKGLDALSKMLAAAASPAEARSAAANAATPEPLPEPQPAGTQATAQRPKPVTERVPPSTAPDNTPVRRRRTILITACALVFVAAAATIYKYRPKSTDQPNAAKPSAPSGKPAPSFRVGDTKVNSKDSLTYVWIPSGTFIMGCSPGDSECYDDEKPAHQVSLSKGFWIGQTPVTQEAYERVTKSNPSHFKGQRLPVETVNWNEAQSYCSAVNMRLPTEAEWEYAARAGSTAPRYGPLDSIAWYNGNSGNKTHEVAQKQANAWGLYDTLGNVWQWAADWYDEKYYTPAAASDPKGPSSGKYRVRRGGSWNNVPRNARASGRNRVASEFRLSVIGFRCAGE
jgi:formylglycine-generating enzyme required for sulfatase activity